MSEPTTIETTRARIQALLAEATVLAARVVANQEVVEDGEVTHWALLIAQLARAREAV